MFDCAGRNRDLRQLGGSELARGRKPGSTTATKTAAKPALAFEATLWAAADKLRGNMDAAEYKHCVISWFFGNRGIGAVAGREFGPT